MKSNTMAVVSLVCGICSWAMCWNFLSWPLAIVAIVTGFVARSQIRSSGEQGDGLAKWGIGLSIALFAILVMMLLAGVGLMAGGDQLRSSFGVSADDLAGKPHR